MRPQEPIARSSSLRFDAVPKILSVRTIVGSYEAYCGFISGVLVALMRHKDAAKGVPYYPAPVDVLRSMIVERPEVTKLLGLDKPGWTFPTNDAEVGSLIEREYLSLGNISRPSCLTRQT